MGIFDWLKRLLTGSAGTPGQSPFPVGSGPARLLVIRHGEKTGEKRDKDLSPSGYERADKLSAYIPQTFGKPDFLIAASSSNKSHRPVQTLKPLSKALGIGIEAEIDDEDNDALVEELAADRFRGRFGVISWRHASLPGLCAALGAPEGTYPDPWPSETYDLSIELSFSGERVAARQVKQPF